MELKLAIVNGGNNAVFVNYERIDEDDIFRAAKEKLRTEEDMQSLREVVGPYAVYLMGTIQEGSFTLINDIDDGVSLQTDNPETLCKLKRILES